MIAPETAAHAAGTAALLPMLTLGIPDSPTAAVLLGCLLVWGLIASMYLGDMAENAFRQSLLGSSGSMMVFVSNPLVASITGLPLLMLVWPLVSSLMARLKPLR